MEDYLVSIIIPAYNVENYIAQTIESVLAQKWQNIEIIVINDGSTDNTEKVVRGFLSDNRVIYITQENSGCSSAKNTGLKYAKGNFIQYLDADDILSSNKISEQVPILIKNPKKIAVCRTMTFATVPENKKENEIDTEFLEFQGNSLDFLLNLNGTKKRAGMIQPNAFLISKALVDFIGPWDTDLSPATDEDSEYFSRAILNADGVVYTPGGINYYRSDPFNLSLSRIHNTERVFGALKVIDKKAEYLLNAENSGRVKRVIAFQYSIFIYMYYDNFPTLVKMAEQRVLNLGFKSIPNSGGYRFASMARIFGMKNSLRIRSVVKQIMNAKYFRNKAGN